MANWQIECKDVLDWCKEYTGPKFHSLLADPPYSLNFMNKKWDDDIAFDPATWAALAEHLLPGAFIMAFASTRGWHRMACAMEDAGLIMQPSIFVNGTLEEVPMMFGWLNAQSFPKASRIDTKIDQAAGADRETVAYNPNHREGGGNSWPQERQPHTGDGNITAPATDLARAWEGHRYGGQILKNCLEPIIVCQKPWGKNKRLDCIVETGAGSLFIDGARVGVDGNDSNHRKPSVPFHKGGNEIYGDGLSGRPIENLKSQGRWPPNFCLVHSPGCRRAGTKRVKGSHSMGECQGKEYPDRDRSSDIFPEMGLRAGRHHVDPDGLETVPAWQCSEECAARRIGEQSGISRDGTAVRHNIGHSAQANIQYAQGSKDAQMREDVTYGGQGNCARFFPQFDWAAEVAERLANSDQVFYASKASRGEREAGLSEGFQMGEPPGSKRSKPAPGRKKALGEPRRNHHPCVKNIALCRWLATLLLPPPEYAPRRILIPFSGVSSEGIGATFAGFDEIVMIEQDAEYCKIGEARMQFWSQFNSYEEAMEATQNIQRSHRKQDAQVQSGQLKLTL